MKTARLKSKRSKHRILATAFLLPLFSIGVDGSLNSAIAASAQSATVNVNGQQDIRVGPANLFTGAIGAAIGWQTGVELVDKIVGPLLDPALNEAAKKIDLYVTHATAKANTAGAPMTFSNYYAAQDDVSRDIVVRLIEMMVAQKFKDNNANPPSGFDENVLERKGNISDQYARMSLELSRAGKIALSSPDKDCSTAAEDAYVADSRWIGYLQVAGASQAPVGNLAQDACKGLKEDGERLAQIRADQFRLMQTVNIYKNDVTDKDPNLKRQLDLVGTNFRCSNAPDACSDSTILTIRVLQNLALNTTSDSMCGQAMNYAKQIAPKADLSKMPAKCSSVSGVGMTNRGLSSPQDQAPGTGDSFLRSAQ